MAIQSYNELYLPYVAENLGTLFNYSNQLKIDPIIFWNTFINSNIAKQIEKGNPKYLCCSALDYLKDMFPNLKSKTKLDNFNIDCFYWSGWVLAHFQYYSGYSFYKINECLPIEKVIELYPTLHEADITKFFEIAKTYFLNNEDITNLKKIRTSRGLSQSQLAEKANVDIRSIQMYEQKRNDINKAQADTLFRISRVLGCEIEDLLESQNL